MKSQPDILYARSFHESVNKLTDGERRLCTQAIEKFRNDPGHPGLNFEYLGKQSAHNHHSIRASKELRIILGVEPNMHDLQRVVLASVGHHDWAYKWSINRGYYTDISKGAPIAAAGLGPDEFTQQLEKFNDAEGWQLFLHPDQEALVHKKFFREARILGAAGTGKTVLAFHRAAWLGNRYPKSKILFTTFSRSLTNYYERLYHRLPNAPSNVEFINIDRLAHKIAGYPDIDPKKGDEFFTDAWKETVPGTALEKLPHSYLKEEVERVIKGRGASRDEYIDTGRFNRLGRRRGFSRGQREICWNLKDAWDARLRQAGITTFADILIKARDITRHQIVGQYRSVIADEYQDFTMVGGSSRAHWWPVLPINRYPMTGCCFLAMPPSASMPGGGFLRGRICLSADAPRRFTPTTATRALSLMPQASCAARTKPAPATMNTSPDTKHFRSATASARCFSMSPIKNGKFLPSNAKSNGW